MSKLDQLKLLHIQMQNCTACELHKHRTQAVSGKGHFNPKLLWLGEAPGKEEDKKGLPFVGLSGNLLDQWIDYLELDDDEYAVTNLTKCRPPNNQDPKSIEIKTCTSLWFTQQLKILNPEIIITVGRLASAYYLGSQYEKGITKYAGKFYGNIYPVPHPSFFLRNGYKQSKWKPYLQELKKYIIKEF